MSYGDLFSGIGCVPQALKELDISFTYKFACEIDKHAVINLKHNHNPETIYNDIKLIESLPYVDLLTAGFPCQPFSNLNRVNPGRNHKSSDLFTELFRCLLLCKPKYFIFENVAALTYKNNADYFRYIQDKLDSLQDYNWKYKVMNSKDYGSPQSRNRIWFIGWQSGNNEPNFPERREKEILLSDIIDMSIPMTLSENVSCGDGTYISLGSTQRFRRFHNIDKEYSPCIDTKSKCLLRVEDGITSKRNLSIIETQQLFGLDNYDNICSDTQFQRQMGNGMDVRLLKLIISGL